MPKRKRRDASRPPPPPPPPKSLVKLLQTDEDVLEYFTLLQANLEADKQKWKTRATDHEKECNNLKKKLAALQKSTNGKTSPKKAAARKPASLPKASAPAKTRDPIEPKRNKETTPKQNDDDDLEIDNELLGDMFEDMSSDDDDDKSAAGQDTTQIPTAPIETFNAQHPFQEVYYYRLKEAWDSLAQLGVALVDDNGLRRSDVEVTTDLLQALRVVTRVQLMGRKDLVPFSADDSIPACNVQNHPAHQAKQHACTALKIMDLYCGETGHDEWNQLTHRQAEGEEEEEEEEVSKIRIGLRNRQTLVKNLMQSLHGEIVDAWPVVDRSARLVSTAVHYDPANEALEDDGAVRNNTEVGAKSQTRLSNMLEQCVLVQLLVQYYDYRQEKNKVIGLLTRYILSTAPSLHAEDYPKYPPVLSLCIVEMILTHDDKSVFGNDDTLEAVALAIHGAALIWKQRLQSSDDRISDIAKVQAASYLRILSHQWLQDGPTTLEELKSVCDRVGHEKDDVMSMVLVAIVDEASNERLKEAAAQFTTSKDGLALLARCVAIRQIQIRQLDKLRKRVGTPTTLDLFLEHETVLGEVKDTSDKSDPASLLRCITLHAKCCVELSSGNAAFQLGQSTIDSALLSQPSKMTQAALQSLTLLSRTPLVRVINLERRRDRRNAFQAQMKVEQLLVVDAVALLDTDPTNQFYHWGKLAFDGSSDSINGTQYLEFVDTHWRPSDLKAFDRDARSDGNLVKMSPSERACALSHVASWIGCRRSLELSPVGPPGALRHPSHALRLFRISGFASGKALLPENESMAPAPVCVVLEDDAILVDRFVDRLQEVLQQLPRDFHFCSLGYGRPKTAPVVPYSTQIGIPTCIWYLTGYIVSLEGAKFLQTKLPVVGPVDSWIGLRMCANWENKYGQMVGVGMQSKAATVLPSTKELGQIMKFRAFCALTPLCTQRVGQGMGTTGRNWRHRDTDIVYSGH